MEDAAPTMCESVSDCMKAMTPHARLAALVNCSGGQAQLAMDGVGGPRAVWRTTSSSCVSQ